MLEAIVAHDAGDVLAAVLAGVGWLARRKKSAAQNGREIVGGKLLQKETLYFYILLSLYISTLEKI